MPAAAPAPVAGRTEGRPWRIELKQLEDKPWYYGLLIGVAFAAGLWAIANWQYPSFTEMQRRLAGLKAEYGQLQEKIERGRVAERRLPQLREEVRRIELDLNRLLEILPTKRNTEELIKKIEALTRQGDFFLKSFTPKEYVNKDFYAEWPIEIQPRRDVPQPRAVLRQDGPVLQDHQRRVARDDGYPDATFGRTLGANFVAKTFIYLGDQSAGTGRCAGPAARRRPRRADPGRGESPRRRRLMKRAFTVLALTAPPPSCSRRPPWGRCPRRHPRRLRSTPESPCPSPESRTLRRRLYAYEVRGRRDPFRSLLLRTQNDKDRQRPPGVAGMLVEELELQGTIRTRQGWIAMMRGGDNRSYLLRKGTTVFDGEVPEIGPTEVVFRQNVNDPTSPKPFRDVVKALALQAKP